MSSAYAVAHVGSALLGGLLLGVALPGCLLVGYDPLAREQALDASADGAGEPAASALDAASNDARTPVPMDASDGSHAADATAPEDSAGSLVKAADAAADAAFARDADLSPNVNDAGQDGSALCDAALNTCGGCAILQHAPATACGVCGLGRYVCSGMDAVTCVGGSALPRSSSGTVLIDDFEDGDSNVNPIEGLSGTWYTLSDGTGGAISPAVGSTVSPISGGAQGSARAMHVSGRGFTSWGAGLAASLSAYQCSYDATAQRGLQFYAKGTGALQVALATRQTVRASQGGACVSGCDDHFNASVPLSTGWQQHAVTFASLKQSGFGTPTTFDASQLMYVQFYFGPNVIFDLYVDSVVLY